MRTGGRDFDDLPVQPLDQRTIFGFGVADDNVVISDEKDVGDLTLGGKGFTRTGRTEDQAVRVFEEFSVYHDEIVGKRVQPAVQRFAAVLIKLLRGKRHKHGDGGCRKAALYLDLIQPQRQAAHQAFFLSEVQRHQLAVILLRDTGRLQAIDAELRHGIRDIQNEERQQKHTLISALQLLQQFFRFIAIGGEVGRDNVHVVACADGLFLLLNLHAVEIGDLAFDSLDGGNLIDRLDVHRDDDGTFHVQKFSQHPVVQFRGEDLQERSRAALLSDAEGIALGKFKGAGRDEVLDGQTGGRQPVPRKAERRRLVDMEHIMQQLKPGSAVQRLGGNAKALEIVENVHFDALETGLCRFQSIRFNAEGDILTFNQAVVALGKLVTEHLRVLGANSIIGVAAQRNSDLRAVGILVRRHVEKRQLEVDGCVEVVEEITPAVKDSGFVFILTELVVDVLKLNGFCVVVFCYPANAVREHPLEGNGILRGSMLRVLPLRACDGGVDPFAFGSCQVSCG